MYMYTSPSNPSCFKILLHTCHKCKHEKKLVTIINRQWAWPKQPKGYKCFLATKSPNSSPFVQLRGRGTCLSRIIISSLTITQWLLVHCTTIAESQVT
jgi:hypothetical protein